MGSGAVASIQVGDEGEGLLCGWIPGTFRELGGGGREETSLALWGPEAQG